VPPLGAVASDPQALQNIISGALAGAAANLGAVTGGELGPVEAGIKMKAQTEAKGMKPVGELQSAKLPQGGHAEGSLTLDPGGCYSIVGFGGLGVFQFQINVLTSPPLPPQVLAQSTADKNDPTVGPNEQCVKNPFPVPMIVKVDLHVIKGQGMVGAQAYKKWVCWPALGPRALAWLGLAWLGLARRGSKSCARKLSSVVPAQPFSGDERYFACEVIITHAKY
jgi:hypothetical protein